MAKNKTTATKTEALENDTEESVKTQEITDKQDADTDLMQDTATDEGDLSEDAEGAAAEESDVSHNRSGEIDDNDQPEEFISEPEPEPVTTQTIVEHKGGFIPMLLGGIAAAGIGYGAAYYGFVGQGDLKQQMDVALKAQTEKTAALYDRIDALPAVPDLSTLEAAQSDLAAATDSLAMRLEAAEAQLNDFDARLTEAEKRPIVEGASDAAIAAYERELKALQDTMAARRAELEAMSAEAKATEESAEQAALATLRRASVSRILTALDAGTGFAPALADLAASGMDVPSALSAVADEGAPSLTELQGSFPEAARMALAASRKASLNSGEESGFSAFLKNQLGARSLEPREGNDPDAVLSRAEAAAREGRLTDALAEIDALPDVGRAPLADWMSQAQSRLDAVAAAEQLSNELN